MRDRVKIFLRKYPLFIFLLPVFFVLHGLIDNYHPALAEDALELALAYIGISLLLAALFWLLFRNIHKAALAAFSIMSFNLFFGSTYDMIKGYFGDIFILKYSFLLPITAIALIMFIIYLKRSGRTFAKASAYLNCLLLILVIIDCVNLVIVAGKRKGSHVVDLSKEFRSCDSCASPDIYLIIADEYPGIAELENVFSFDNSPFENELQKRGFHIIRNSTSNYNATYYSMASLLSMEYLRNLEGNTVNHRDLLTCAAIVNNNNVVSFFKRNGYLFFNHSFFELAGKNKAVNSPFYSSKKKLITSQTFINRLIKNIGFNFFSPTGTIPGKIIDSLTRKTCETKITAPKFVYAHLDMPHHPYYFNRDGQPAPPEHLEDRYKLNKPAFLEYLLYTNKILLELIDHIKKMSSTPPVIVLMSDHGFRQFTDSANNKFHFINFNSIYLPDKNYTGFYDGMSNVNQFRVLLNSQFGQKLSLLKDSTSFLNE